MKKSLTIVFLFVIFPFLSQESQVESDQIQRKIFETYDTEVKAKRGILQISHKSIWQKVNPLNYLATGLLFFYQNVLSEQISATCSYEISCSEYTKLSIQKYGLIKGTIFGIHQLANCTPGNTKEHCKHVISSEGKIINWLE